MTSRPHTVPFRTGPAGVAFRAASLLLLIGDRRVR
jgi:hypothetical protein